MTSKWDEHQIGERVTAILAEAAGEMEGHHFGAPFLSAYQLAIEFAHRHPEAFAALDMPLGGAGTGEHNSLARYLPNQLSRRIKSGQITNIEGAFLSNWDVSEIVFDYDGQEVRSSLIGPLVNTSMFRMRTDGATE